ncbi:TetR/AcrR family transcriptional regulator [Clostridium sp. YIM B02505]|uniref:TetR/AcrR family transcriptional regulator n=1 Tax=Clostridium yunnanense TaxID=2800325 RepID=A0ABS1ESH5_9CLOT|nr:TetR/AcrR family transcriptional regulator [Clostridium yunnanense]MBK1812337.1 TetR/AcrR family transcriptional regulator [Clostridium yunnanense]
MAQTTKKALAASLKKLLSQKPMDKITIVDIVEDCEVNRQTFYYHFKDIYDLVEWIYTNEASQALGGKKTYATWQQGFMQIFEYVSKNKDFVLNTYHSLNREHLENYLYSETYNLLLGVVEEKASGITARNDDKAFIANFYKYAFVGLMLEWIGKGMKDDPSVIISRVNILIYGSIAKALENFRTNNHI